MDHYSYGPHVGDIQRILLWPLSSEDTGPDRANK